MNATNGALLGEARVDIVPNLDPLAAGFAKAKTATTAFQTHATKTSLAARAAFEQLSKQSTVLGHAIRSIDGPLGGFAGRLSSATSLVRSTGPVLAGMALGIGAVTIATRDWFHATVEAEDTMVMLRQALRTTGRDAELSAVGIDEFSKSLSAMTTIGDEAITQVQTRLVRFDRIGAEIFPRATQAILDFAVATKRDLASAANVVGSALQNPVQGLDRLRRAERDLITGTQADLIEQLFRAGKQAEATEMILQGLEARFKGAAQAARTTFGGAIQALGNSISDMTEVSGGALANMTAAVNFLNDNLEETVDIVKAVGLVGGTLLVSRFFGPVTQAALTAAAAEVQFQSAVIKGNAVALNGVRAAEMRAAATAAEAAAAYEAAKADAALAAQEVRNLALNREMIASELALADARLQSHLARSTVVRGEGGRFRSGATDELTRMAELQRQNAALGALQAKASVELGIAQAREAEAAKAAGIAQAAHATALTRASLAARVATGAVTALRGVMAFFGGPVGLAITAAAAGLYLLSRNADDGADSVDDFATSMSKANAVLDSVEQNLARVAKETRDAAIASNALRLAKDEEALAEKRLTLARVESALALAKSMNLAPDIAQGTKRVNELTAEIDRLTMQVVEGTKAFIDLRNAQQPKVAPRNEGEVDPEILRRRRETIKSLQDEAATLARLVPLYQAEKITLDELNTTLAGEKVLTDLLLTSKDKEGRQILDLIAKRDKFNKSLEITKELQMAAVSSRAFDSTVPALLAAGVAQEDLNEELQFQVSLERDLIQLGLARGSVEANNLEQARRGEMARNKGLDLEFRRRELLAGGEESIATLEQEAAAFGMTAEAVAEAAKRMDLWNKAIDAQIPITAELAAEIDRLAKGFGKATGTKEITGLIDELTTSLSNAEAELGISRQTMDASSAATQALTLEQQALARAALMVEEVLPGQAAQLRQLSASLAEAQGNLQVSEMLKGLSKNTRDAARETELMAQSFGLTAGEVAALRFEQQALADITETVGFVSAENAERVQGLAAAYGKAVQGAAELAAKQDVMLAASSELSSILKDIRSGALSAGDAMMRLADAIADAALEGSLFGQGPLAGILGTDKTGGFIGGGIAALLGLGKQSTEGIEDAVAVTPSKVGDVAGEAAQGSAEAAAATALTGAATGLTGAATGLTAAGTGLSVAGTALTTAGATALSGSAGALSASAAALTAAAAALTAAAGAGAAGDAAGAIEDAVAVTPALFHSGHKPGAAISARRHVTINPRIRIPRHHEGLRQNEHLAVLEDDEEVLTRKQQIQRKRGGDTYIFQMPEGATTRDIERSIPQMLSRASDQQFISRRRGR